MRASSGDRKRSRHGQSELTLTLRCGRLAHNPRAQAHGRSADLAAVLRVRGETSDEDSL